MRRRSLGVACASLGLLALFVGCVNELSFDAARVKDAGSEASSASDGALPEPEADASSDTSVVVDAARGGPCDVDSLYRGAEDGCTKTALCQREVLLDDGGYCTGANCPAHCYEAVPCNPDGTCATGVNGALCNDGLFPQKARVCVPSFCRSVANCPASFRCVGVGAVMAAGFCSSGAPGQPCTQPSECASASCLLFGPIGICK